MAEINKSEAIRDYYKVSVHGGQGAAGWRVGGSDENRRG